MIRIALLILAILMQATGCAAPGSDRPEESFPGQEVVSNGGRYRVQFSTEPDPIPTGELFALSIRILDSEGGELQDDVGLIVDAGMPQHQHGMNVRPSLSREEDGSYRVEGMLFHMPGEWTVTFDLERAGITERAQVELDVD